MAEEPQISVVQTDDDGGEGVMLAEAQRTPEELVAKAIAPVKREFLRPPPSRHLINVDRNDAEPDINGAPLSKEKKSKRQLKRERIQAKKSALHLCPAVAKSGQVSSCPYNENCRYSHDIEAFKELKQADLEGSCPFLGDEEPCPYGLACLFAGTHKDAISDASLNIKKKISEVNGLDKAVQKLLWKNKMQFPKADAQLKFLGLLGPKNSKTKKNEHDEDDLHVSNGSHADADENGITNNVECSSNGQIDNSVDNSSPPLKKAKSSNGEEDNGASEVEKDIGDEPVTTTTTTTTTIDHIPVESDKSAKLHPREKKLIDFRDKLYLAPLTTVGNLPFRRVCKVLGADVTCGEMAMCTNLLQGQASEWALLRRHSSEDLFGVQICGAYPDTVARTVELIEQQCTVDFIDINMGCPIDIVVNKGAGSALITKPMRMKSIIQAASSTVEEPITVKVRTAYFEGRNRIDSLIADMGNWGATAVTIHGRSRQQRYSKLADWEYIYQCTRKAPNTLQVLGNGDVFSYLEWNKHKSDCPQLSSCMIARGALVKPWLFTEIKEQRHWDISSSERFDILKDYVRFGLQHWGSDAKGVETTRHFLLEWLSYTCRYIPIGLLDVVPQKLNWRPPSYFGRNDLETLMSSDSAADWVRISEMLLGKVPDGFTFTPKHKSNAYDKAENG